MSLVVVLLVWLCDCPVVCPCVRVCVCVIVCVCQVCFVVCGCVRLRGRLCVGLDWLRV